MKQTMKRALSLTLALALSAALLLPAAWAEGENAGETQGTTFGQENDTQTGGGQEMQRRTASAVDEDQYYFLASVGGETLTEVFHTADGTYPDAVYDSAWNVVGKEDKTANLYTVTVPYGAESVELDFLGQDRLAYGYDENGLWVANYGDYGDGTQGKTEATITGELPDHVRVQTPYDGSWNSDLLYVIAFQRPFTVKAGEELLTDISRTVGGYTYTDYNGTQTTVDVYTVTIPENTTEVEFAFPGNRLAYNYTADGTYLAGAYTDAQVGASTATVSVDASPYNYVTDTYDEPDGVFDYIQVQTPYDGSWNSDVLYAVTFQSDSETPGNDGDEDAGEFVADYGALLENIAGGYASNTAAWPVFDLAAYNGSAGEAGSGTVLSLALANAATGRAVTGLDTVDVSGEYAIYTIPYLAMAYQAAGQTGADTHSAAALKAAMRSYLEAESYSGGVDELAPVLTALAADYLNGDAAVAAAVDKAVTWLSAQQNDDGTYSSYGAANAETTAMAVIALSALGIDAHTDARFVKTNGTEQKSAIEGLLSFAVRGNTGFGHASNASVDGNATEQGFRALVAYAKMREKGGAYNIYLEAKNSTSAVSAPDITATVPMPDVPPSAAGTVTFTLVGDNTWISRTTVTLSDSIQTVGDVFAAVLDDNHYTYVGLADNYVRSITTPDGKTLAEFDGGKNSGWMYTVNGAFPAVALNDCYLTNGDSVRFFYTYDYTREDTGYQSTEITVDTTTNSDGTITVTVTQGKETLDTVSGGVKVKLPNKGGAGDVVVLVNKDGSETIVTKSLVDGESAYALLDGTCTVKIIDNAKDFADVSDTAWYAGAVDFVSGHGLYNGTGNDMFSPNQPMSRAMLAAVLYRLESEPGAAHDTLGDFADGASVSDWAQDGVAWAVERDIMQGVGGSRLASNDTITREQLAAMVYRYAKLCGMDMTVSASTDISGQGVSAWAETAMAWAVENGIIEGRNGGKLAPQDTASRAEVAAILQRLVTLMVK